jgi:Sensors of blue-light using FAD
MILVRLAFFSCNELGCSREFGPAIRAITTSSWSNNLRDDITGALIYNRRWFAQVLEGAETPVSKTFERILCDRRHSQVTLISMQPVTKRLFDGHPLRVVALGEPNDNVVRHYCDGEKFDPRRMRADRISDLIEAIAADFEEFGNRLRVRR